MALADRRLVVRCRAGIRQDQSAYAMAEAFEQVGALDKLEGFASFYGADWYGLARNTEKITLRKTDWTVPTSYPYLAGDDIVPLRAGETLAWKLD